MNNIKQHNYNIHFWLIALLGSAAFLLILNLNSEAYAQWMTVAPPGGGGGTTPWSGQLFQMCQFDGMAGAIAKIHACTEIVAAGAAVEYYTRLLSNNIIVAIMGAFFTIGVTIFCVRSYLYLEQRLFMEACIFLLKFGISVHFLLNMPTYLGISFEIMRELQEIVTQPLIAHSTILQGCVDGIQLLQLDPIAPGATTISVSQQPVSPIWGRMDCMLGRLFGFEPGDGSAWSFILTDSIIGITIGLLFRFELGFMIFFMAMYAILQFVWTFGRMCYVGVVSIFMLCFLTLLGIFFIPLFLLPPGTIPRIYADNWAKQYPRPIVEYIGNFAVIALFFIAMEQAIFGDHEFALMKVIGVDAEAALTDFWTGAGSATREARAEIFDMTVVAGEATDLYNLCVADPWACSDNMWDELLDMLNAGATHITTDITASMSSSVDFPRLTLDTLDPNFNSLLFVSLSVIISFSMMFYAFSDEVNRMMQEIFGSISISSIFSVADVPGMQWSKSKLQQAQEEARERIARGESPIAPDSQFYPLWSRGVPSGTPGRVGGHSSE